MTIGIKQFAELCSAMARQLPAVLARANPDSVQHLIENPEDLQELMSKAILSYQRPANFYVVDIDYNLPIELALEKASFDSLWYDMNPRDWESDKHERKIRIEIALIRLEANDPWCHIYANEVVTKLAKMKFRPANLRELLALAAQYPDLQKSNKIVGFGTIAHRRMYGNGINHKVVSYLTGEMKTNGKYIRYIHHLDLDDMYENHFDPDEYLFAAVRDHTAESMNSP